MGREVATRSTGGVTEELPQIRLRAALEFVWNGGSETPAPGIPRRACLRTRSAKRTILYTASSDSWTAQLSSGTDDTRTSSPEPHHVGFVVPLTTLASGRRLEEFSDPSIVRPCAQSRAEIGSPRTRGPYSARCEISPATGVRAAALQSKGTDYLHAYANISTRAIVPLPLSRLPVTTDPEQMDQLRDYADSRLLSDCIYCGGPAETRDHVPSRCLLERPYPENLPAVGCCKECN